MKGIIIAVIQAVCAVVGICEFYKLIRITRSKKPDDKAKVTHSSIFLIFIVVLFVFIYLSDENKWTVVENHENLTDDSWMSHKYEVFSDKADTWEEAQMFCVSIGGHLATISNPDENDHVFRIMQSAGYTNAYFGFTDKDKEGTWIWVNGEKGYYTNWHSNEPNNENSHENYAMFYYVYIDGTWNDGNFAGRAGKTFICEWDTEAAYEDYLSKR